MNQRKAQQLIHTILRTHHPVRVLRYRGRLGEVEVCGCMCCRQTGDRRWRTRLPGADPITVKELG